MPDYNLLITDDFVVRAALLLAGFVGSFWSCKKPIKGCLRVIARAMVWRAALRFIQLKINRPPLQGPQSSFDE